MSSGSLSRRYARALIELATEQSAVDAVGAELSAFTELFEGSAELQRTLDNPGFSIADRKSALVALLEKLGASVLTRNFLSLVMDKGRIAHVSGIGLAYQELSDEQQGRIRATVRSARPLSPEAVNRLKSELESSTGKAVILTEESDPSLIGGMVTQVGNLVFDGSVATALDRIRQRLVAEHIS